MPIRHCRLSYINKSVLDQHVRADSSNEAAAKRPMVAYSRGSNRLAGAASLKNRMPAIVGAFRIHPGIAQLAEQQTRNLWAAGSTPAIQLLCEKQPDPSDPGLAPAALAR